MRPFLLSVFTRRALVALACVALGGGVPGCDRKAAVVSTNPLVITPQLALEQLHGKSVFYNAAAREWLQRQRPELLPKEDRGPEAKAGRSYAQAVQAPKLFRQLDRQQRFDALLLVGDPSEYRPLLEHLLETKDWQPAYVDHTSLIFTRGGGAPWQASALAPVRSRLAGLSAEETGLVLAQLAGKLIALRQWEAARTVLDEAEAKAPNLPEVWAARGQYHLGMGDWKAAEAAAERALALDAAAPGALGVKAQALYATKRFAEAYRFSAQLMTQRPDDPGLLFYHAKIAREAKQYEAEIAALERLIALAQAQGRVDPGYRVYLGQAFASNGDAEHALAEFALALADPELPAEQRQFAQETSTLIRQKVAPPKTKP